MDSHCLLHDGTIPYFYLKQLNMWKNLHIITINIICYNNNNNNNNNNIIVIIIVIIIIIIIGYGGQSVRLAHTQKNDLTQSLNQEFLIHSHDCS